MTLTDLNKAHAWLQSLRPLPADVTSELRHRYEVALTHHSTAIEGNTLTQSETEMVIEKGITIGGKSLVEHLEVVGHKEALDFVIELADHHSTFGEREIREIHSLVMKGQDTRSGAYRTLDVKAAGTGYVYPSHPKVQELMADFVAWMATSAGLHPVLLASEAHLRFVTIHPFQDENGRVGRLLMNLLLLRTGYPIAVLPVTKRPEYIAALEADQAGKGRGLLDELVIDALAKSFRDILQTALSATSVKLPPEERTAIENWISSV